MTLVPLFIPSTPFTTPLSEMFEALFGEDPEIQDRSAYKTDIDEGLGEILYTKLIRSPKSLHVDEAFAEVALTTFSPKWINFLCQNDTPAILLARFRQCASTRTSDTIQRDETLCTYLLTLLSFTEVYEEQLHVGWDDLEADRYRTLTGTLRKSLRPGYPLHRWNELPEALRPLLFALRTNIMILQRRDSKANELPDCPWEMAFQDIPSAHRIHFTLAACRGLVVGWRNIRMTSSFILSLVLAKGR